MSIDIYALEDPRDKRIRYVGQSYAPHYRLKEHSHSAYVGWMYKEKSAWIQELREANLKPNIIILEHVENEGEANARERYWIGYHLNQGAQLFNLQASRLSHVRVKHWRIQKGLTRQQLSRQSGIPAHLIGKIEREQNYRPHLSDLRKIAHALNITLEDLLTPETVIAPSFEKDEKALWIYNSYDTKKEHRREITVISSSLDSREVQILTDQPICRRSTFTVDAAYLYKIEEEAAQ